jgi:hypothetical protein
MHDQLYYKNAAIMLDMSKCRYMTKGQQLLGQFSNKTKIPHRRISKQKKPQALMEL